MTTGTAWLRRAAAVLLAAALLAYLWHLLVYLNYSVSLFRFPFDYDQGEGFELYDTLLHARGQSPYRDASQYPFYTSIYPPVFHLITVPLVWAFGPQMWTGRLVGFAASLIAAAAIGWAVHRETRHAATALLSGLAFLASNYVYHIGPLFRQHITMVALETLAIVVVAGFDRSDHSPRRTIVWTVVLLLAAGFTKQLAVSTAAAALAFLFLRCPLRAVKAAGALVVSAALLFGGLQLATGGHWFTGVVLANVNEFSFDQAAAITRQWAGLHAVLIALAALRLIYETYASRLSAYAIWFVFSAAAGLASGKFGAGESYFVTAVAAACLLSGLAVGKAIRWAETRQQLLAGGLVSVVALAYLVQARLVLHMPTRGPLFEPVARLLRLPPDAGYYDSQGYTQLGRPPDAADIQAGWQIAGAIAAADGPPLSEEAGFPLAVGQPVIGNPFPLLMLYRSGHYDPSEFVRQIDAQAFGLVVLRAQFYPDPILQAIGRAYQPMSEIRMNGFTYRLLGPRPRESSASAV